MSILAISTAGCGDYVLNKAILIEQHASTLAPGEEFDVDMSQIPSAWIEQRIVQPRPWGELVKLRIDSQHPVKILLVPVRPQTRPSAALSGN